MLDRRRGVGALLILGALVVGVALARGDRAPPAGRPLALRYAGVNLASGEFMSKRIPGRYGYDYAYPDAKAAAPFLAAGMTAVRVPLLWQRIQPAPSAPLDEAEMRRLDASFADLRGFRLIILDVHDYGRYRGEKLDQPERSGALLADLWRRLATRYRSDRRIAFGIMNEPNGIAAPVWRGVAEQTLRAIRETGARNLVLIPGTDWSGAHSWTKGLSSNGSALADLKDPGGNMAFEMHQYLDKDSSGTKPECVSPEQGARRLAAATAWLRQNRARGFLGEFGVAANPNCLAALDALLGAVDAAPDVWLGWTYWAGGGRWGAYPMSVQPDAAGPKPQFAVLLKHLPPR